MQWRCIKCKSLASSTLLFCEMDTLLGPWAWPLTLSAPYTQRNMQKKKCFCTTTNKGFLLFPLQICKSWLLQKRDATHCYNCMCMCYTNIYICSNSVCSIYIKSQSGWDLNLHCCLSHPANLVSQNVSDHTNSVPSTYCSMRICIC